MTVRGSIEFPRSGQSIHIIYRLFACSDRVVVTIAHFVHVVHGGSEKGLHESVWESGIHVRCVSTMRKTTECIAFVNTTNTQATRDRQERRIHHAQASALGPRRMADEEAVTLTSQSRAADSL